MGEKRVVLAPLDPVHDIGLKLIARGLEEAGHKTWLFPPDYAPQEILNGIIEHKADVVLISRTLGYGVEEVLARFVDLVDAAGVRDSVKLGVGGMAIRPELAAELGFDAGFGPGTPVEAAVAFVEGRDHVPVRDDSQRHKIDLVGDYTYSYNNLEIRAILNEIASQVVEWAEKRSSPGVERAKLREEIIRQQGMGRDVSSLKREYAKLCDSTIAESYRKGMLHPQTRRLEQGELDALATYVERTRARMKPLSIRHTRDNPAVFVQYGTGCPFMDIAHIKIAEAWGADGVVHFDPSWG